MLNAVQEPCDDDGKFCLQDFTRWQPGTSHLALVQNWTNVHMSISLRLQIERPSVLLRRGSKTTQSTEVYPYAN